ncbi:MAG: HlyD family efflux transporter periplasmic adaptor subunit [Candidatus Cloacimonetes bacterium]|nr:HlyD family efflux transporter periplasmic adaptor subunit [Candidatus Cloacimonadota bacterium]
MDKMDKELSTGYIRKQKLKKASTLFIVLLAFVIVFVAFRMLITPSIKRSRLKTSIAETGSIEGTITASGLVIPEFEQVITSPFQSRIDSVYQKPGDQITVGASILKLNNESTLGEYEKRLDEYELTRNRKKQLQLSIERTLIDLNTQFEIKRLKVKALETNLEAQEMIYKSGGGARTNYDQARLNLEIAILEKGQLQDRIKNTRKSLTADLIELDLTLKIQSKNIAELKRQLELAQAKSLRAGVLTWVNDEIGSTVYAGDIIARVADLDRFKIEAKISDIHAAKLLVGNPVRVRINEYDLLGRIASIKPTIERGIIVFYVDLDDNTNENLRSNLRVDVFVITSSKDNVVRIENGPAINGSGKQNLFVVKGNRAERRTVLIGATNFDYAEIESGIEPGEEVIISDMSDHQNRKVVKIK